MANSSDWMGALRGLETAPQADAPGWMALVAEPPAFREALAYGVREPELPTGRQPDVPEPVPDPAEHALARAFADGEAAGRRAAAAEADAAAARQRALRLAFRSLDETAREVLSHDLADTVIALCDSAIAGCVIDRDGLLARCQAAARRIGGAAEALNLHLHPDDLALLGPDALGGWQVTPDPAQERGRVLIEGAEGVVSDGPAEWRRAIAAAVRG
ncbi:MAG: hypothetical protein NWP98_11075 [Erythrobacter sp.]|nr:hypothetical protein [Erythrobacter sp.]